MAGENVDITIFAATGSWGRDVVEEFLVRNQTRKLSWGIAGRNEEKLRQVLDCASKKTGLDVSGVRIVIAECNDRESLDNMALQTRVVINCCGPCTYRYGESVAEACDRNVTDHVHVSEDLDPISTSKLICFAQKGLFKTVDAELVRRIINEHRNKEIGSRTGFVQYRKKSSVDDEELDLLERLKRSPLVRKLTKNSPSVELDHLGGQHNEENLGLDESSRTFLNYWQVVTILLVALLAFSFGYILVKKLNEAIDLKLSQKTDADILEILKPLTSKLSSQQNNLSYQIYKEFTNLRRSPARPAVFLLLSDQKSERTSSCVAKMITSVAEKILWNNEGWLFLNGSELSNHKSGDSSVLAGMIEDNMYFSKVVVVSDIHKIPGHLAAGFHFLIDLKNPIIKDAVYVFTMTVDEIVVDAAAKILFKSWSDLSDNILYPLVYRVTDVVLHIVPEERIGTCPLKTDSTYEIRIP